MNMQATAMSFDSGRDRPVPKQPWIMRMIWSELLFAHWSVEPNRVAAHLPPGVELDVRDGLAWIGVVPFQMSNVGPRFSPSLPGLSRFLELNLRTYVTVGGIPGVWFFSLDAANRIAVRVARATFNLPYMDAEMSIAANESGGIQYSSRRFHKGEPPARFDAAYSSRGASFLAEPGSLEHWLTSRYCLYCVSKKGHVFRGEIDHPPWRLSPAKLSIKENTMADPIGIRLDGEPHSMVAETVDVRAWLITRC